MISSRLTKSFLRTNFRLKYSLGSIRQFAQHHDDCQPNLTLVRRPAPEFKGNVWWEKEFKSVSLKDFKGKWVCLFFYPLNFTFVCPTEIVEFDAKSAEFEQLSKFKLFN